MKEIEKRSYPELEGKIIGWSYKYMSNNRLCAARIVGCDYHIGITMVDPATGAHRTCLRGPLAPQGKTSCYDKDFVKAIVAIRQGFYCVDTDQHANHHHSFGIRLSAEYCAFGS